MMGEIEPMTRAQNIPGAEIKVSRDRENGKDFINIKDYKGDLILKVDYELWGDGNTLRIASFDAETRDRIINQIRRMFG